MTQQAQVTTKNVSDTALVQEPTNPFAGSSLVPMLVGGLLLCLVGMIAAAIWS